MNSIRNRAKEIVRAEMAYKRGMTKALLEDVKGLRLQSLQSESFYVNI